MAGKVKRKHLMVDIETLGTAVDSVIACIAVVPFNPETGHIGAPKEWRLSVDDGARLGFKMDCETVKWWQGQTSDARSQLDGELSVRAVFLDLLKWLREFAAGAELAMWANSPSFDLMMLRTHFERLDYGHEIPWEFWQEWDVRTVLKLAKEKGYDVKQVMNYKANHLAVDDARYQAEQVSQVWQKLGLLNDSKKVA